MKEIEKELDRLVQELHKNQRCHICRFADATAIHHIIGRRNKLLRYDLVNLLPVCYSCHSKIHDMGLDVSQFIPSKQWQYLQQIKNKSYKDILTFELGMTEEEYLKQCRQTLKRVMR